MRGLFITGTDTGVGKTYIGARLVKALLERGVLIKPRKPLESGCLRDPSGNLVPVDGEAYWSAIARRESLQQVTPYRFEPPISPERAARLAGTPLTLQQLKQACLDGVQAEDFLLVEGAGGFYSPLVSDGLNADLAVALDLPVLLVAEDRLGCINQVLLSVEAIQRRGLALLGVVLNRHQSVDMVSDNLIDLQSYHLRVYPARQGTEPDSSLLDDLLNCSEDSLKPSEMWPS